MSVPSYPKIYTIGHKAVQSIFDDEVVVEEKLDGSQWSIQRVGEELFCRSKGVQQDLNAPDKLFEEGVSTAKELFPLLRDGWVYRGEYFKKPKHNTLAYSRIPNKHFILFDVTIGKEDYLSYEEKQKEAERLGLECVPILFKGKITDSKMFLDFLKQDSCLGGVKPEGVVVKNYSKFCPMGKAMMAKFVSEEFKEVHRKDWKDRHPGKKDIVDQLADMFTSKARWLKAVQRLRDDGELEHDPRDIGKLMAQVSKDVREECEDEIKELLFKWAWKNLSKRVTSGLPRWYKERLVKEQFGEENGNTNE